MHQLLHYARILFYSKDVRLPTQLQRAMAAEAEAAREARAKVNICNINIITMACHDMVLYVELVRLYLTIAAGSVSV